ncbi:MAG TPA: hypothetical protein VGN33_09335 [Leifsonia sp.]|jgi:hypothetical protein|nr:hypothetical protein [Leifsonia sp.]
MTGDVMGGGMIVAIAAALWLAYLIPVWLRRREYLTTERNAVRLQQTLRILAETAEIPDEVRLEANARTVAEQQRILKRAQQKTLAEARAAAAADARREQAIAEERRLAAEEAERAVNEAIALERAGRAAAAQRARVLAASEAAVPVLSPQRRRRLRRSRALSTVILVLAFVGALSGAVLLATAGAWLLLAGSALVGAGAIGMLARLARPDAVEPVVRARVTAPPASRLYDHADHDVVPVRQRPVSVPSWTPQPLPKPLHLSRGTIAASAMASLDAATELRRAAARAEIDRKATELVPAVAPLRQTMPVAPDRIESPVATAPSRYASMGVIDGLPEATQVAIDLDAVLLRRRAAS